MRLPTDHERRTPAGDAQVAPNNAYVIPGASGNYMGMAVIYVGRTSASVTRYNLIGAPGPGQLQWNSAISHYESGYASITAPPTSITTIDCLSGSATCYNDLADWTKRLDAAQTNVYGGLNLVANGFASGTTNALGALTTASTVALTRVIGQ